MKIKLLIAALFPVFIFGQRGTFGPECSLKSFKTTCINNKKIISEVIFPATANKDVIEMPLSMYGRFEDLQRINLKFFFALNTIHFTCNEDVKFKTYNDFPFFYAQKQGDNRKFYFLLNGQKAACWGTVEDLSLSSSMLNLDIPKRYMAFFRDGKDHDPDYEVMYNIQDKSGNLAYSFHQRGNEFDEYTYQYTEFNGDQVVSAVYKNNLLFEDYMYSNSDDSYKKIVSQYIINKSYRFDGKGNPVLKRSAFSEAKTECSCSEGYITTIEFWNENKCERRRDSVILD